jgi:hypothetical protein
MQYQETVFGLPEPFPVKTERKGGSPLRSLVLIAGIVGVLLYTAVVSQRGLPAFAAPHETVVQSPSADGLKALETGLAATGARLEEVKLIGWGRVREPGARDRVVATLGARPAEGESRVVSVRDKDGHQYVTVQWTLTGKAATHWAASLRALQKALEQNAHAPSVSVQLGGTTAGEDLTDLTDRALGALRATDRQPWSDPRAASVAGRTTHLPPGPFGVNVQVAVRTDPATGMTRVWVAWPALMQEY